MSSKPEDRTRMKERKKLMRRRAYDARAAQEDKDAVSAIICDKFAQLPEYRRSKVAMWYVDCRSETRTKDLLQREIELKQHKIVVPYCTVNKKGQNKLGLWLLESFDELHIGKWNILEPPRERWGNPGKEIAPKDLDIVMVPGVGFDKTGGRMGNGQGYYDRLLEQVRPDCPLVALCYECQIFDSIIVSKHDVFMDKVITEKDIYQGVGRG